MNSKAKLLMTTAISLVASGFVGSVQAADLTVPVTKAPPAPMLFDNRPYYLQADVGVAVFDLTDPQPGIIYGCPPVDCDNDVYISKVSGQGGPNVGIRLGYQFTPMLRADISFQYMSFTAAGKISDIGGNCSTGDCGLNNTKSAHTLVAMINGYVDLDPYLGPRFGHWHPYLTAGIGAAWNTLGANCISCDYAAENESHTTSQFAWAVGVGTRVDVFQDFKIDLAYRFYGLGKFQSGLNGIAGGPENTNGGDSFKAFVHTVTIGLVYPFR